MPKEDIRITQSMRGRRGGGGGRTATCSASGGGRLEGRGAPTRVTSSAEVVHDDQVVSWSGAVLSIRSFMHRVVHEPCPSEVAAN